MTTTPSLRLSLLAMLLAARAESPVTIPTLPGIGFAMIGVGPGETARINALNSGPVPPVQDPAGCEVTLQFYDLQGQLAKQSVVSTVAPGKAAQLDLSREEMQSDDLRAAVRAVLHFGYFGGAAPSPEILRQFNCNIQASIEVFETASGNTRAYSTDAKPLPAPFPPPP